MTPLEAAKEAIRLADVYKLHPHPMGGHGDPVRGPGFDLDRHIRKHAIAIATALIEAERRLADLEMILRAANGFDGVRIDKGVFMKTRWTILRREFSTEGGKPRLHGVTSFNFEEDGVTPILTDEARAALAGDPK